MTISLTTFVADTPAVASEINDNFTALKEPLEEAITDIVALETKQNNLRIVNALDYTGIVDDAGVTDITTPINNLIKSLKSSDIDEFTNNPDIEIYFPKGIYKITGTVLVPSGFSLNFNNSVLIGGGFAADKNIMFDTAYWNGADLVSNWDTTLNSHRIVNTKIRNAYIKECLTAIRFYNANENSAVKDIITENVYNALITKQCFYSSYERLTDRTDGLSASITNAGFTFMTNVNTCKIDTLRVEKRTVGISISGGFYGSAITNCALEGCTTGLLFSGTIAGAGILHNYFEGNTTDVDLGTGTKTSLNIDMNRHYSSGTAYTGSAFFTGRIGCGNNLAEATVTTKVNISDNSSSFILEAPYSPRGTYTQLGTLSGYTLGQGVRVQHSDMLRNGSGVVSVINEAYVLNPFKYSGKQGSITNVLPFTTTSAVNVASPLFDVQIDTDITTENYACYVFCFNIRVNAVDYVFAGRILNNVIYRDDSNGKTLTRSDNAGKLRLTASQFSHATQTYTVNGAIRHM